MKLRVKAPQKSKSYLIHLFSTNFESPIISIFREDPLYTLLLREVDGNRLLHKNVSQKLKQNNIDITVLPEIRAKRSIFLCQIQLLNRTKNGGGDSN